MTQQHDFCISWGSVERGEMGEERLSYDCMKSNHIRAKCTRKLKSLLKTAARDAVYYVRFSNQTIGISDRISGYNGKIVRQWDQS